MEKSLPCIEQSTKEVNGTRRLADGGAVFCFGLGVIPTSAQKSFVERFNPIWYWGTHQGQRLLSLPSLSAQVLLVLLSGVSILFPRCKPFRGIRVWPLWSRPEGTKVPKQEGSSPGKKCSSLALRPQTKPIPHPGV